MPTPEHGSSGSPGSPGVGPAGAGRLVGWRAAAIVSLTVAVVAAAAALAATAGPWALAGVLLIGQAGLAWAWTRTLGASAGTVALIAASALACDLAVLWPGDAPGDEAAVSGGHGYDDNGIGTVAGVVGVALAVTVLYQLGRRMYRSGPARESARSGNTGGNTGTGKAGAGKVGAGKVGAANTRTGDAGAEAAAARVSGDMAAALGGIAVTAFLTGFLVLRSEAGAHHPADDMVVAGLLGVGASVLVGRLAAVLGPAGRGPLAVAGLAGAAAGSGAGALFGTFTDLEPLVGTALAAAGAIAAAGGSLLMDRAAQDASSRSGPAAASGRGDGPPGPPGPPGSVVPIPSRSPAFGFSGLVLAALLPLALAAPMVYLVGRQLPG